MVLDYKTTLSNLIKDKDLLLKKRGKSYEDIKNINILSKKITALYRWDLMEIKRWNMNRNAGVTENSEAPIPKSPPSTPVYTTLPKSGKESDPTDK